MYQHPDLIQALIRQRQNELLHEAAIRQLHRKTGFTIPVSTGSVALPVETDGCRGS